MYELSEPHMWTGRVDSTEDLKAFRLHQAVEFMDVFQAAGIAKPGAIGIIGFKSDEGVRRNKGRTGSCLAPDELRKSLAALPLPSGARLIDFGSIVCEGGALEEAQAELGRAVSRLFAEGIFPIILGGGHEVAFGHYLGYEDSLDKMPSVGIVNIDAHFDMRPYEQETSSGTMFRQILDRNSEAGYFCAGIQPAGNTEYLFETARIYGTSYILEEDITEHNLRGCLEKLEEFMEDKADCMLTLCCDVLEAGHAPGVSAPSPFGLHPKLVRFLIRRLAAHPRVRSFDIAEVNPRLDEDGRTVKLAALLIHEVIAARSRLADSTV
ncbi:formimidoylglutamase [Peribacillus sp. SCS-26]|uniref:formimidoylglutamase n=1 Tax=Paraperibacillus marinus TaxID=3115295 RepID=UPI003905922B